MTWIFKRIRAVHMIDRDMSSLKREVNPVPSFVEEALNENGLIDAYLSRPPYQQNDYISWITRAKREETRINRLNQMLEELRKGDVYMKMRYHPKTDPQDMTL